MADRFYDHLEKELAAIKEAGLHKEVRTICSAQDGRIELKGGQSVLNFCANNYLGLANHPYVIEAAKSAMDSRGYGMASVPFICGIQDIHLALQERISDYLRTESTLLYSCCFDANGGLFETLLSAEDAVISDSLNHASIIDGVRLSKAKRFRFESNQMADLEAKLKEAQEARFRLIATDGVFSMDGVIANLPEIRRLADRYDALVMIDECHATGFMGPSGRGTHDYWNMLGKIDIITGTLGKALGGASGGFISGKKQVIDFLRQRSRPHLFSNSVAPPIVGASLAVFDLLEKEGKMRQKQLFDNTRYFREKMSGLGFKLAGKDHPIIPVMLEDAPLTQRFASAMLEEGIYVVGFFYPVVPHGKARIRTQMSAAHGKEDLDRAIAAFEKVGKALNVI